MNWLPFVYLAYRSRLFRWTPLLLLGPASLSLGTSLPAQTPPSHELHVAAAADLQPVLPTLAADYERLTGTHLLTTFGSSATLTQQIQNGAPEDLFLSADCTHPQQLNTAHLAEGAQPYAHGVLVLWARKDSPAQPLSVASLSKATVARVAVANDLHAPYGQAATAAIKALHLQSALAGKLVTGENIMQTAQFADTGNAQAAFISLTIASSPHFRDTGTFLRLPDVYPPIHQCAVVLSHAPHPEPARAFLRWLTSPDTQHRLPQFGLEPAQ